VPIASVTTFHTGLRMAGPVEKTPSLAAGSSVASKCCLYASHASTAPRNAPISSALR
jgi:hypothetical protein